MATEGTKKTAALIVAGLPGGDKEKPEAPDLESLMEELGAALSSHDWGGAAKAFKAAHGVCGAGYEGSSEEI